MGATPAPAGDILAIDLDVVTVTDTSVILTWFTGSAAHTDAYGRPAPVPADTQVLLGEPGRPATMRAVMHDTEPTAYHYAEITGLEPGRSYGFEARSAGRAAAATSLQFPGAHGSFDIPGTFTTLTPPPGKHLFTMALAGDTHIGETTSGLIAGGWPPAVRQDPGLPPYPEVMLSGVLDDLRQPDRGASVLLVAGDITAEAAPHEAARARRLLDGWGALGPDYLVVRGNHDRPHTGAAYAGGTPVPGAPDHHDCWGDVFGRRRQELYVHETGSLRIIGLDTTRLDAASGTLSAAQFSRLKEVLADDRERPTLVFGHHPVTYESAVTGAGPAFNLDQKHARALERLYGETPGVFFHQSGHTHRNNRTAADAAPGVEFLEVGAVKEYPGGYCLLRLYTGGYMVNFYKTRTDLARRWSQRSRGEYFGIFAHYAPGTIADRNHSVTRDLSGLTSL